MNEKFVQMLRDSERIVFFGGAGVSTESGIPDFRSEQGIYKTQQQLRIAGDDFISYVFYAPYRKVL